jgi:2-polyprenyl-3-methyl-5-hydroxy-6-metoxy-1,4-benzoquinol methylase
MQLSRDSRLLDIGCGTGALALGFAPYAGPVTGLDQDGASLDFLRNEASERNIDVTLVHAAIETCPDGVGPFDAVVIGRAHAQLPREPTLARLERLVSRRGRVLICRTLTDDDLSGSWATAYRAVGRRWGRKQASLNPGAFMSGSQFQLENRFAMTWARAISVDDLLLRSLTYSGTTAEQLGSRKTQYLEELRSAIAAYSVAGTLKEVIVSAGVVFARPSAQKPEA